jgi:hypothetical protein
MLKKSLVADFETFETQIRRISVCSLSLGVFQQLLMARLWPSSPPQWRRGRRPRPANRVTHWSYGSRSSPNQRLRAASSATSSAGPLISTRASPPIVGSCSRARRCPFKRCVASTPVSKKMCHQ